MRPPDPVSKIWQYVETGGAAAVALKWPNDVHLRGGKVAGILVEGRPQERWAVVGIGINVAVRAEDFPPELRGTAATIGLEPASIPPTLARLMQALDRWLVMPERAVLDAFRIRDALIARQVRWVQGGAQDAESRQGRASGIDADGRLLVSTGDGETAALDSGEVRLIAWGVSRVVGAAHSPAAGQSGPKADGHRTGQPPRLLQSTAATSALA
jgi:biotin-(acetyl-CoA carboxylase) ligase